MSMPGTAQQKRPLMECMSCHTLQRIVRSTFNAEQFVPVLARMAGYANNTIQARVQMRVAPVAINTAVVAKLAAYLATINLSNGPVWNYELKTLPRPKGRATMSSSPSTICRARRSRRMTCAPTAKAMSGIRISSRMFLGELDRPVRSGNIRFRCGSRVFQPARSTSNPTPMAICGSL